ncbi:hypothetical protein [Streptomyces griseoruber]|nr:hypothetical protein [Streptomyces griseoruber]GLP70220.1 hypothetical protein TUSST3_68410 [Streptomyces sp. TUS-ST3]
MALFCPSVSSVLETPMEGMETRYGTDLSSAATACPVAGFSVPNAPRLTLCPGEVCRPDVSWPPQTMISRAAAAAATKAVAARPLLTVVRTVSS